MREAEVDGEVVALGGGGGGGVEEEEAEGWDVGLGFPCEPPFCAAFGGFKLQAHFGFGLLLC